MTTKQLWKSLLAHSFEPRDWYVKDEGGERHNHKQLGGFKMWVYKQVNAVTWAVGFFSPAGEWLSESTHGTQEQAANRVHWLNGGGA